MMKNYKFKVSIIKDNENYLLKVKPVVKRYNNNPISLHPIKFFELNIPIVMRTPQSFLEIGWEQDYFLNFENVFDEKLGFYSFFGKPLQRNILSILEEHVNNSIVNFLKGDMSLLEKEKYFEIVADNGLQTPSRGRRGNPKGRMIDFVKKGKGLSR